MVLIIRYAPRTMVEHRDNGPLPRDSAINPIQISTQKRVVIPKVRPQVESSGIHLFLRKLLRLTFPGTFRGMHQVEYRGNIRALNLAASYLLMENVSLGLSYSLLSASDLSDAYGVTVLGTPAGNLASDTTTFFPKDYAMDNAAELNAGLRFRPMDRVELSLSARLSPELQFSDVQLARAMDDHTGLPELSL